MSHQEKNKIKQPGTTSAKHAWLLGGLWENVPTQLLFWILRASYQLNGRRGTPLHGEQSQRGRQLLLQPPVTSGDQGGASSYSTPSACLPNKPFPEETFLFCPLSLTLPQRPSPPGAAESHRFHETQGTTLLGKRPGSTVKRHNPGTSHSKRRLRTGSFGITWGPARAAGCWADSCQKPLPAQAPRAPPAYHDVGATPP